MTVSAKKKLSTAQRGNLRWVPITDLRTLQRNPQYLTPKQLESLARSIERDGFCAPILVRPIDGSQTYEIVSGNHRMMAAAEAGYSEVPCIILAMDDRRARRVAINLNTVHGNPEAELLAPFLAELDDESLAQIHLEAELQAELVKFDALLESRLRELQIPEGRMARGSPKSNIVVCSCTKCGNLHMRGGGARDE